MYFHCLGTPPRSLRNPRARHKSVCHCIDTFETCPAWCRVFVYTERFVENISDQLIASYTLHYTTLHYTPRSTASTRQTVGRARSRLVVVCAISAVGTDDDGRRRLAVVKTADVCAVGHLCDLRTRSSLCVAATRCLHNVAVRRLRPEVCW